MNYINTISIIVFVILSISLISSLQNTTREIHSLKNEIKLLKNVKERVMNNGRN